MEIDLGLDWKLCEVAAGTRKLRYRKINSKFQVEEWINNPSEQYLGRWMPCTDNEIIQFLKEQYDC